MPSNGDHLAAAVTAIHTLHAEVVALTAELAAVRAELVALNAKTPALVGGKVPAMVTADGALQVTTSQLPATLSNGKVKVTGLL